MNDVADGAEDATDASGRECELKLDFVPADLPALRRRLAALSGGPRRPSQLATTYFDTPGRDLEKADVTLRVRRQGRTFKQTIKRGEASFGLFDRLEIERRCAGEIPKLTVGERQALEVLTGAEIREDQPLEPVFRTVVKRATFPIGRGATLIEVALDDAVAEAAGRSAAFYEIELELMSGEEAALFGLARELMETAPLRMGVLAKSTRGRELARGGAPRSSFKAKGSPVRPGMSVEQAFLAIVADCVLQFRRNEDLILGDPRAEAIHQARVALRRLRSAFTLFKPLIADTRTPSLAEGLKWLAGELGAARDLDVLLSHERQAREDGVAPESALPDILEANRAEAYASARAGLNSPRALSLMVDLAEWAAIGDWRAAPETEAERGAPIAEFAEAVLGKRFGKVMKRSKGLTELDVETRHEVRKEAKKLRYATDFFGGLYDGRRYEAFAGDLAKLQDGLGALNDIATAREATGRIAKEADDNSAAFAAGMLAGQAEARAPRLLRQAEKRRAKLKNARKFWK